MTQKVVIVESPAKAKTINKYLGSDYTVLASFGHIRDLPPKDGSVRPEENFAMDWELGDRAQRPVSEITKAVKNADAVYLASDPDREGEAIAWHVLEVLKDKNLVKKTPVHRVTFNEITKKTVLDAIDHPREIDSHLVDAYMARRALDYLVGFSLSPVLWRKLPGSKSAGRVQSVALRLICERESEIEIFRPQEFWTIEGLFDAANGTLPAHLTHLDGKKLDKFAITTEAHATATLLMLKQLAYKVSSIEKKQSRRNPYPPFTTSTLQQEASRRLGLGATRTMRIAQSLYEGTDIGGETVGLITYMRTDGVSLSTEAIAAARKVIESDFGKDYLPSSPRLYKSTAKNAQEAHEAIRPTDMSRRPQQVAKYLNADELKLYTLIWQRTMACQMASAVLDQVAIDITGGNNQATFRATGSTVVFEGWLKIYHDQRDEDAEGNDENRRLPAVSEKESLKTKEIKPEQHFTQPPPRYTEASLVKKLEELGIGRPSTYASIMQVLQDRDYVKLDKKRFVPEDRGRIVTAFLEKYFSTYVQYDFTADLEEKLDEVSDGRLDWKSIMQRFWMDFSGAIAGTQDLKISDVIDALDEALGPHFFPPQEDGHDPRKCTQCADGRMGLKLGKFGAFIGCSNYPTCRNTRPLMVAGGAKDEASGAGMQPRALGSDPKTQMPISVRVGPYGPYVQLDPIPAPQEPEAAPEINPKTGKPKKTAKKKVAAPKPKRVSLPKGMDPNLIDLDTALKLLGLPREIGAHPETGDMITADIGRYGPYIKMGSRYKSLTDSDDLLSVGINRAVSLFAEPDKGGRGARASSPAKNLGDHPQDSKPITLNSGRFGPYVKWGKVMATVTKAYDPENLTLDQAVEIIETKLAKGTAGGKKAPVKKEKSPVKKAPAKVAAKKPATKKPAAKTKKK